VRGSAAEVKWVGIRRGRGGLNAEFAETEFAEKSVDEVAKMKGLLHERERVYLFPRAVCIPGSLLNF